MFVLIGFIIAISPDLLFFSMVYFVLMVFLSIMSTGKMNCIIITFVYVLILLLSIWISIYIPSDNNKKRRTVFDRVIQGYAELYHTANKSWLRILKGTTGEKERAEINKLRQQLDDVSHKYNKLLEIHSELH